MEHLGIKRIGEKRKNNNGSIMEIVEYKDALNIWVSFTNSVNKVKTTYFNFQRGGVRNLNDKSIYKIGYLGEGEHKANVNGKQTTVYQLWHDMLKRCYYDPYHKKYTPYKGCTVAEEWHNFQNFATWYDENYYEIDGETMCLDKDILVKGNKIYSSETCVFVPQRINKLFTKRESDRGDLPIGVTFKKSANKYSSQCNNLIGEHQYLGVFDNILEAFYKYKSFKENIIKEVATQYKDKIPEKLYNAMYTYEVEITD